jgi:hypothetical protein
MIAATIPDWLPQEAWAAFKKMRARKGNRAPFTEEAEKRILLKLDTLRLLGHPPEEVLWQSVECGWSGIFPLKAKPVIVPTMNPAAETPELRKSNEWLDHMAQQRALRTPMPEHLKKLIQRKTT